LDPLPRIYLDENVPVELAARLQASGFDVSTAREADMLGASDEQHLQLAALEHRVVITQDLEDFTLLAHTWVAQGLSHSGIVLAGRLPPAELHRRLVELFEQFDTPTDLANVTLRI
jgi:predicted nuclease of predicted toxin-antitoxin system